MIKSRRNDPSLISTSGWPIIEVSTAAGCGVGEGDRARGAASAEPTPRTSGTAEEFASAAPTLRVSGKAAGAASAEPTLPPSTRLFALRSADSGADRTTLGDRSRFVVTLIVVLTASASMACVQYERRLVAANELEDGRRSNR